MRADVELTKPPEVSVPVCGHDRVPGLARKNAPWKMARPAVELHRANALQHNLIEIDRWNDEPGNHGTAPNLPT